MQQIVTQLEGTMSLANETCEVCRVGAPTLTDAELAVLMAELPQWEVVEDQGVSQLQRVFTFSDFISAQVFTNRVADLAEVNGHHPAILLEWGRVKVSWWTHKIRGLHKSDVIMAAKTDKLEC